MARKLLSLVVALAVVLSSMSFAFAAADPEKVSADVSDAKVKAAVMKLVALGMVEGYEDGTYRPAEKLTRAQMTKLITVALGLGPAADAAIGTTSFSDVPSDHWASGYINVASGQGLVQGMGDGTFAPEAEVTYAQALTMLVRALGYTDDFLKGTWPGNYLAKASEKGLTNGITVIAGSAADRAAFALMMSNTLEAKVVKVSSYEGTLIKYAEDENTTLLKDKLKLDKAEVRPIGNARLGDTKVGELKVRLTKALKDAETDLSILDVDDEDTFDAPGIDTDAFLGATCNIYVKDKDTIVYIESTGNSETVWDGVDKWTSYTANGTPGDIKLRWSGRTVAVKGGDVAYNSSEDEDYATFYMTKTSDTNKIVPGNGAYFNNVVLGQWYGKWVIENGKIVFADLYDYETAKKNLLVKSVDTAAKTVTYIDDGGNEAILNLASSYSDIKVYAQDGSVISLSDIKEFDVICISNSKTESKEIANIFVFRNTKTGNLVSVSSDAADGAGKLELDGGVGFTDIGTEITFSKDNNSTFKGSLSVTPDALDDFYDAKVTLIIDNNKKIRHIYGETESSSTLYGIVKSVDLPGGTIENVKLYLSSDETVTYSFEDSDEIYDTDPAGLGSTADYQYLYNSFGANNTQKEPLLMKYKLTKDGKISKNSVVLYENVAVANAVNIGQSFGDTTISTGSESYTIGSDIKIFDAYAAVNATTYNTSLLDVATWDNLKNKDITSNAIIYLVKDDQNINTIEAMVILSDLGSLTNDLKSAYLINTLKIDGDDYGYFKIFGDSEAKRYEIEKNYMNASSSYSYTNDLGNTVTVPTTGLGLVKEAAVIISVGAGGKVTILRDANQARDAYDKNFMTVAGRVYSVDGSSVTLATGTGNTAYKFKVASDAVVYINGDVKSFGNVNVDDIIVGVVKDGTIQAMELQNAKKVYPVETFGNLPAGVVAYDSLSAPKIVAQTTKLNTEGYYAPTPTTTPAVTVSLYVNADGKVTGVLLP